LLLALKGYILNIYIRYKSKLMVILFHTGLTISRNNICSFCKSDWTKKKTIKTKTKQKQKKTKTKTNKSKMNKYNKTTTNNNNKKLNEKQPSILKYLIYFTLLCTKQYYSACYNYIYPLYQIYMCVRIEMFYFKIQS